MDLRVAFETFFSLGFCGLVLLLVSGLIWHSSPAVRYERPPTAPAFYPVLGVLVALLLIVFGSHVHWGEVVALIGGAR